MPGSILNRLIFAELVKVFLLSLVIITGLLVTGGMAQEASRLGLSFVQVLKAIPLFVPNTLPYTIPATTLFASCVVYGRLAHDNEVVAIRAAGVHLATILKPALVLGAITTCATASLYHTVIPRSQQLFYQRIAEDPEELVYNMLRRDQCVRHGNLGYVLYVGDVRGRILLDVVIKRRAKVKDPTTGKESFLGYDFVARAREAKLRVDPADGKLYVDPDRFVIYDRTTSGASLGNGPFPIDLPDGLNGKDVKVRPSAILWDEFAERIAALREEMETADQRRRENQAASDASPDPEFRRLAGEQEKNLKYQYDSSRRLLNQIRTEQMLRPAFACGCLLFALLGCPVGIWANRADYLSTFVVCFLPAVFIYYPLVLAGIGMGKDGKLPLWLGCWMANIVLGAIAVFLNIRLLRR